MKRKGQFFIIGGLLLAFLMFFGMSIGVNLVTTKTGDLKHVAYNLEAELPHALNIGVNDSSAAWTLRNFTLFSVDRLRGRGTSLTCLWVIFSGTGSGLNATAGNFMGGGRLVSLNVSGTVEGLWVDDQGTNSTLFPVADQNFTAGVSFDAHEWEEVLLTNKTSLYIYVSLARSADDVMIKEILA